MKHANITPITPNRMNIALEAAERYKAYGRVARERGVTKDTKQPKEILRINIFSGSKG